MEKGDIVRVSLQESDGTYRARPALLIRKILPYNDWLLCAISGSTHLFQEEFDVLITKEHPDFSSSRLKHQAIIRTGFLFTISEIHIEGKIGTISQDTFKTVITNLVSLISKS